MAEETTYDFDKLDPDEVYLVKPFKKAVAQINIEPYVPQIEPTKQKSPNNGTDKQE